MALSVPEGRSTTVLGGREAADLDQEVKCPPVPAPPNFSSASFPA